MKPTINSQYIRTLRPEQWYKNLVVFVAIIFATQFLSPQAWFHSTLTFISFCFLSSAGYIINDLHDIEVDKLHPKKKNRPIALGMISKKTAIIVSSLLALAGLALLALTINPYTSFVGLAYLALTVIYTHLIKSSYYPGLATLGLGFVLRAIAGCTTLEVTPSIWLLSCVFILALILTTAKRGRREGLVELSIALLFIYSLYTLQRFLMVPTIIPAIYIIHRYLKLQPEKNHLEVLLKDRKLQLALLTWVIMASLILYFGGAQVVK